MASRTTLRIRAGLLGAYNQRTGRRLLWWRIRDLPIVWLGFAVKAWNQGLR